MRVLRGTVAVVVALIACAACAVQALPARPESRTISVPLTLSRSLTTATSGALDLAFPATHVAFSWTGSDKAGVAFRTPSSRGGLGRTAEQRWTRAEEAHDLEDGLAHYSGIYAVDRVTSVQWRPAARRPSGPVTLHYMNTLDGPVVSRTVSESQDDDPSTPDIVTRAEWGANESLKDTTGDCKREFHPVQQLFVHHTAGSNFDDRPKATMRAIYHYHAVSRGWCDVGYNFVISPNGTIFEGRWARDYKPWELHDSENSKDRGVTGAHVSDFNSGSIGISIMGNFSEIQIPPEARTALTELLAWEADRHGLRPKATHTYDNPESNVKKELPVIAGHRDAGDTECPGNFLYASLRAIRRDTKATMGDGKLSTAIALVAAARRISYGEGASYSGRLVDEAGAGLVSRPVSLYRRDGTGDWRLESELLTGLDGRFSYSLTPEANVELQAFFEGDEVYWGAQDGAVVKVKPEVTLVPEGGTPDASGVPHYPPGTTLVRLSGGTTPLHPGAEVTVTVRRLEGSKYIVVAEKTVTINDAGTYVYKFRPESSGTYRAVARFHADDDHAKSYSPPAPFVID